jgi:hypothetical protein
MVTVMVVNVKSKAMRSPHCFCTWYVKIVATFLVAVG